MAEPGTREPTPRVSGPLAPAATAGSATATRGFLFADLRDYTGYMDAHGDHAGADLLVHYRSLVREAVAASAGAEIRTEGDGFYVVFDSASAAVQCGMAIVAAADATTDGPGAPIHVGVGVHAGETVETPEGYVGSAVNIAARLCGQAKAGELIVSDTVRALTRSYLDVRFEPLGARRLKGLDEPIAIYRVVPRPSAESFERRSRRSGPRRTWLLVGIGAGALILVAGGIAAAMWQGSRPSPSEAPGAAPGGAGGATPTAALVGASPVESPASSAPGDSGGRSSAEKELLGRIPREFQPFCRRSSLLDGSLGGDRASLRCDLPVGTAEVFGADSVWYDSFSAPGEMAIAVNHIASLAGLPPVDGGSASIADRCASPTGAGIGRWALGITFTGQLACYAKDAGVWILWTYEGQQVAARAVRRDGDAARLYAWWRDEASGFLR